MFLHLLPYPPDGDDHLRIHRIHRDIQDLRHFPVFEPIFPHQFEHHLAPGRQRFHRDLDLLHNLGRDHLLVGMLIPAKQDIDVIKGIFGLLSCFFGQIVQRRIFYPGIEIGFQILNGKDLFFLLPQFDEYVIYHLNGPFIRSDDGPRELNQPGKMQVE